MRYFLLGLLAVSGLACDNGEPITAMSSPIGCWRSNDGELDLMADGSWRQVFDVSPTVDMGSWVYNAESRELTLSIANASSANGPAVALSRITDLTPTDMWTAGGSGWTHWQSTPCRN